MSLNHYDLFTAFDLVEAAHLAAGVEPKLCLHENQFSKSHELFGKSAQVKTLVDAMNNGLNGAFCNVPHALLSPRNQRKVPEWALIPTLMSHFLSSESPCFTSSKESIDWARKLGVDREENHLIFDRSELRRWFDAKGNGFKTEYEFVQVQNSTLIEKNLKLEKWPGGNHHTEPQADEAVIIEKPLGNRERDSLLTIIAALCNEAKLDYTKHAKTAGMIQSTAAKMGLSIGESTIESHLKKIPNALAGRMK